MRIGLAGEGAPPPAALLDLLEAAGLPVAALRETRPPALSAAGDTTWLLAAGADVLRACDRGRLDLGVVGKDQLLEARRGVVELLDLGCCRDALVYAVAVSSEAPDRRRKVATRYPRVTRRHFALGSRQPEILVMDEPALAPALGLADGVVELAGRLAAPVPGAGAALEVREEVAACSARLVAGRSARALLGARLGDLLERLRAAMGET